MKLLRYGYILVRNLTNNHDKIDREKRTKRGARTMKFFHTADWHLGKIVQGVHMTEDQEYVLKQFVQAVETEKPDAVIIAGDLYDRPIPPTEAVQLLDDVLCTIVIDLHTPVLAIAGNHDSPSRLHFANKLMKEKGFHIIGEMTATSDPVVLHDDEGEVHVHLVPYCDPSVVRYLFDDDTIKSHDDATRKIVENIHATKNPDVRHIYVGHAFVTPYGEEEDNTSESERPLSIGGAEYVQATHFTGFDYTALGHLHRAHAVQQDNIRYAGSPLKYSISEAAHDKGYYVVEMDAAGQTKVEKRTLAPRRDMRRVEAYINDIVDMPMNDDYVFVTLLDDAPVLSPMEKIRAIFPNAMDVDRTFDGITSDQVSNEPVKPKKEMSDQELFASFYHEVKGFDAQDETTALFTEVLDELLAYERNQ